MQPPVRSGFSQRTVVFSCPDWDSMSGSAAWTDASSLTGGIPAWGLSATQRCVRLLSPQGGHTESFTATQPKTKTPKKTQTKNQTPQID